jgi:hypothetical protein
MTIKIQGRSKTKGGVRQRPLDVGRGAYKPRGQNTRCLDIKTEMSIHGGSVPEGVSQGPILSITPIRPKSVRESWSARNRKRDFHDL